MHLSFNDWIGTVGVTILLIAFLLNLSKKLSSNNLLYILMNMTGASLACLAFWLIGYIPFVVLEGVWTIVSFAALVKYFAGGNGRLRSPDN